MKWRSIRVVALMCGLCLVSPTQSMGQEKKELPFPVPKTGPEHQVLASLAGTYEAKAKAYFDPKSPMESTGVMKRQMILDGRFMQEDYQGNMVGQNFRGMALVGFDVKKKKYVTAWVDSLSTSIMITEGTYDAATKTLTSIGEDFDPGTGQKMKGRDVLKIVDADTQTFEMYRQPASSDKEFKVLEIVYKRKK
jgi:hypothetical protein